jgi:hypothetical protein
MKLAGFLDRSRAYEFESGFQNTFFISSWRCENEMRPAAQILDPGAVRMLLGVGFCREM